MKPIKKRDIITVTLPVEEKTIEAIVLDVIEAKTEIVLTYYDGYDNLFTATCNYCDKWYSYRGKSYKYKYKELLISHCDIHGISKK